MTRAGLPGGPRRSVWYRGTSIPGRPRVPPSLVRRSRQSYGKTTVRSIGTERFEEGPTMANTVSCACGWDEHGTEEEVIEAFVQHVEEGHGKQISRETAAARVREAGE